MASESPRSRLWLTLLAAATGAITLSGCAAVAIPVLAGGVIARDRIDGDGKPDPDDHPERIPIDYNAPPGTRMPSASPVAAATPAPPPAPVAPKLAEAPPRQEAAPVPPPRVAEAPKPEPVRIAVVETKPTVLAKVAPPVVEPQALPLPDPSAAFAGFALNRAPPPAPGTKRLSALLDQETIADEPRLSDCGDDPPAVVVDLDPGDRAFDPTDPPLPAPGLAARLAELRSAGVTVLWSASVPVERAQEVWTVLRATGLDPDRTDRLVLPRRADERKQVRRLAAGRDWCVVAIAGDRRGDFDEVFDYLRDPEGPIAKALEPTLGQGWFLVPTPIE
jgi:hypothetical protein